MSSYYDRDGKHLTYDQYLSIRTADTDLSYRTVAADQIGDVSVSTVWLGMDHSHTRNGPPLIFETLVWRDDIGDEIASDRYSTLAEAQAGHQFFTIMAPLSSATL